MFYKVNAARVTLREFWFETKLFVWVGLLVKLLRIRLCGSTDDLAVDSLHPFLVSEDDVPEAMRGRFAPALGELRALGFGPPVWHYEEDVVQATRNTLATLLHESGRSWARVQCRVNFVRVPAKTKFFTTFISKTPGGFVVTGNGKYDMAWPASHEVVRWRKMPERQVWERHQQRVAASAQRVAPGQLLDVAEEYHTTLRDFHLARGVFSPLGPEELAMHAAPPLQPLSPSVQFPPLPLPLPLPYAAAAGYAPSSMTLQPDSPPCAPLPPPDLLEAATLDELRRLQSKQANWRLSLALLGLSAAFFVLRSRNSDDGRQGWEYVAILVGVLLFHELGHYLAMKAFGYRNLRMFFIPGFGAAVSGRHYNAPAWKKILVSLMGPLPGILVGGVTLIAALVVHNDLLYRVGLFAVIINAFNLIPVLPLDGGWVAHAAIFSRNPKLDVGFRVVAALALLAIGLKVPGTSFLPYIAVAGLMTLPMTAKLAAIVGELRLMPQLGVSPDSQTIPTDTARVILAKVRERFKRNLTAKLAAQHVASVFESLNARPPSAGATVGLLAAHAGAFVFAALTLLIGIAIHGRVNRSLSPNGQPVAAVVTPGQIEGTGPALRGPHNTVVVSFKSERSALTAFHGSLAARRPTRFGQTVFVDFSPRELAEQQATYNRYKGEGDGTFVASSRMDAEVELTFAKPDSPAARDAVAELEAYLRNCALGLIPPWASEADWPAAQRGPQLELRRLLDDLQRPGPDPDPAASRDRWKRIDEARRSGDTAEADRLQAEQKTAMAAVEQQRFDDLARQSGHPDLVAQYQQIAAEPNWVRRAKRVKETFGPLLGQWPTTKPDGPLVTQGFLFNTTLVPRVYTHFKDVETGLPAYARWLFAHGIHDVHYRISSVQPAREPTDADGTMDDGEN